jgi:GT2 family glycosyltransferase
VSVVLSTIIPTYRRNESLAKLLLAIRAQTLPDIEIVVVDQNAPGYLRQALPAGMLDGVLHVCLEKPNASTARNHGFALSHGEYVLFIDDDCAPEPDFCERAVEVFQRYPEVKCLWPVVYSTAGKEDAISRLQRGFTPETIPGSTLRRRIDARTDCNLFERDYFHRTGGFDELLFEYARTAEDQEFYLRMRLLSMPVWVDTELFVFHDEGVPGGCDLRTESYWNTRAKCVKAWAFRYRIHGGKHGKLSIRDLYGLARSSFLNSGLLRKRPHTTMREIALLWRSINDSRVFLKPYLDTYVNIRHVNHLRAYRNNSPPG